MDIHLGLTGSVVLSVQNWGQRPIISSSEFPGMSSVSERESLGCRCSTACCRYSIFATRDIEPRGERAREHYDLQSQLESPRFRFATSPPYSATALTEELSLLVSFSFRCHRKVALQVIVPLSFALS